MDIYKSADSVYNIRARKKALSQKNIGSTERNQQKFVSHGNIKLMISARSPIGICCFFYFWGVWKKSVKNLWILRADVAKKQNLCYNIWYVFWGILPEENISIYKEPVYSGYT